jgi:hypothetical protein
MKNSSENQKKTGAWPAMRAILWSFIGVRSKGEYEADITRLTMTQHHCGNYWHYCLYYCW